MIDTGASAQWVETSGEAGLADNGRLEYRLQERAKCGKRFYSAQWMMMMMMMMMMIIIKEKTN